MWWRFLRLEVRALREEQAAAAPPVGNPVAAPPLNPGPSPFRRSPVSAPAVTDAEDPELAEYNRILAALARHDADGT
jgi:hypothetical protein